MSSFLRRITGQPIEPDGFTEPRLSAYRGLWILLVVVTLALSIIPLTIITVASYQEYAKAVQEELIRDVEQLTSNAKCSFGNLVEQSVAGLRLVINEKTFQELSDDDQIARTLRSLRKSCETYVDLGLINSEGVLLSYAGPYNLKGNNYADQEWFHQIRFRNAYFSDVFMGYRKIPHFAVAVKHETEDGRFYVLRATFDIEALSQPMQSLHIRPSSDAFVINQSGILQTPSRLAGGILDTSPIPCPTYSPTTEIQEGVDSSGESYILGYAYIPNSPFILMILKRPEAVLPHLASYRTEIVGVSIGTVIVVVLIVLWGATYLVRRIQASELARSRAFREMQHTSKMATIGRLAAGVAHEINNPLAIINEKAGLIRDYVQMKDDVAKGEKLAELADSILSSVQRCSTVTHRLLGFAKRMEVSRDHVQMDLFIEEVLGFLGKESEYRNITVNRHFPEQSVVIESDRGQLQQVFLNVINNAFEAVDNGGRIDITVSEPVEGRVATVIADNGRGIASEDLDHIFEPFFTTKKVGGTGLGLSITYGIVEKLGGRIAVESVVGEGTRFTITLPVQPGK